MSGVARASCNTITLTYTTITSFMFDGLVFTTVSGTCMIGVVMLTVFNGRFAPE